MNSRVRLRPKSNATPSVANAVKSVAPNDKAGFTAVVSSENTKNPTAERTIGTATIASRYPTIQPAKAITDNSSKTIPLNR